jgi:hypothetical protein
LNLPAQELKEHKAHYMLNLDETCILAGEGTVKIIGDGSKKSMKRCSMTAVAVSSLFESAMLLATLGLK